MSDSSELVARVRAKIQHGVDRKQLAVAVDLEDLQQIITEWRDAEMYITLLRVPLLYEFGTTDPELLMELFKDRAVR